MGCDLSQRTVDFPGCWARYCLEQVLIHSLAALSNPISEPAFSLANHLYLLISLTMSLSLIVLS